MTAKLLKKGQKKPSGITLITTEDGSHTLFVQELNEHYHSIYGAVTESDHVFIKHGYKTVKQPDIRILEIGFGTGLNVYLTALECEKSKTRVEYTTIEKYPLEDEMVSILNYPEITGNNLRLFKNIHKLPWEGKEQLMERFTLHKVKADLRNIDLEGEYDLIYFDAFGPDVQPDLWTEKIIKSIGGVTAKSGIFVTYSAKGALKRNLISAGFDVYHPDGPPGKRQITRAIKL